jgi:hypothetical protein
MYPFKPIRYRFLDLGTDMWRREFISLLGSAAAWPLAARAQQPSMPVIGYLSARSPADTSHLVDAFRRGLRETGFIEGQNVAIEYRWGFGDHNQLPKLAEELVRKRSSLQRAASPQHWQQKLRLHPFPLRLLSAAIPLRWVLPQASTGRAGTPPA